MSADSIKAPPPPAKPKIVLPEDRSFRASLAAFIARSLSLFPVLVLVRTYELWSASRAHPLPDRVMLLFARGLWSDVGLVMWTVVVLAAPVLLLARVSPRIARLVHRIALVLVVLFAVALTQYFAVTFVPLGSDLFGYSFRDIRETANASAGIGFGAIFMLLLFGWACWIASRRAARYNPGTRLMATVGVLALLAVVARAVFIPRRGGFATDASYFVAVNKVMYFAGQATTFAGGRRVALAGTSTLSGYPLLHAATHDDVLGPLFKQPSAKRPNLVFIIVEGLGRDFVGANARYGGFTPFLDSLSTRSLYWENFLSSSGRTFSVLPSLFASAPYGTDGFMQLGANMPRHVSLISLLRDNGYRTDYFTGTDGHFDNIDVFMNREGVDNFVDQAKFGRDYSKQPGEKGFSWGYGDDDLFKRSFETIGTATDRPRLDIYLTITTHEPFIPPRTAEYDARFAQRLASLRFDESRRDEYTKNQPVFRTLLYLDDAIRSFIAAYQKRPDFDRTIFFITGDHRLIPLPERGRLDRYHVPLIVYSPMIAAPRTMSSVSSHLDVTPSVIAMLEKGYGLQFPQQVAWLGTGIDTATQFRSVHSMAFMRTKNTLEDFLDHENFLSGDELFRLGADFALQTQSSGRVRDSLRKELDQFRQVNRFTTSGDHLYPGGAADTVNAVAVAAEDKLFYALGADTTPDRAFQIARKKAFAGDYPAARSILHHLLRASPNDHDSQTLLGRTYAWDHQYDTAKAILRDLVRRAPEYADGSAALIDVELWSGKPDSALALAAAGLNRAPKNPDLLFGKAKALEQLDRRAQALAVMDTLLKIDPNHDGAAPVRKRLQQH